MCSLLLLGTTAMGKKADAEREKLKKAFKVFDEDNSGSLDAEELKKILKMQGDVSEGMTDEDIEDDGEFRRVTVSS